MQKIVFAILRLLEKVTGKHFIYLPSTRKVAGKSAVKSDEGFWYVGDITDAHDLAYGVLYNGSVEPDETELVRMILQKMLENKPAINFYDVGANSGYYGILAAFLGKGKIRTLAFEPIKEYSELVMQNAYINRLENFVKVYPLALSDRVGQSTMTLSGSGSTLEPEFLGGKNLPAVQVVLTALDELSQRESLPRPDFIKIDVEGHELSVLKGAMATIQQSRPVLFIEIAKTLKNLGRGFINSNYDETFGLLNRLGYKIFCLDSKGLVQADKNFCRDGVNMYLCLADEHLKLITGLLKEN